MALEEPQLNGRIASVIGELTVGLGWRVREELKGALRGPQDKPDVLITRADSPPIVLENEYHPARTVVDDCLTRLGRELNPPVAESSGTVSTVIAIRSPASLHKCATGSIAEQMLKDGEHLDYAAYQGTENNYTRFPQRGFISGDIRHLIDFIKPAAEAPNVIEKAVTSLRQGTEDAAAMLMACPAEVCIAIAAKLRQPYPPVDERDRPQEAWDKKTQREQTAKMAAAIMINAMACQQNLTGYRGIKSLAQVRAEAGLTQDAVIEQWEYILSINYWPIFHIAKELLLEVTPFQAEPILERMNKTANRIQIAIRTNDVAGIVFQKLISDRRTLATYYTRPESTTLAAYLAVPENLDWANPETLKNYHIADYACGTGGLPLAAYQRARELHRNHGGNPDSVHSYMMENCLTACDIMPAGVHLTASLLSSVAPRERYEKTRSVLYDYGDTGSKDKKGNPVVSIGSLELLDLKNARKQAILPLSQQMAMGAAGEQKPIEVDMSPLSQDLVIMNPPFTSPTKRKNNEKSTVNLPFAAFQTTPEVQKAMSVRTKKLSKKTIGDGNAGLGSHFTAIAHNMVKPNGHIALILPMSSMQGGSYDGEQSWSWQKLRRLVSENYNDIVVISIAQAENREAAFSADTEIGEVILIARRLGLGESPRSLAHFVNLKQRPANKLEAQETAKAIRQTVSGLMELNNHSDIKVGDNIVGSARLTGAHPLSRWGSVRVVDLGLVRMAEELSKGSLRLPQHYAPVRIPIAPVGALGVVGPIARDIEERGPFSVKPGAGSGTEWPMLWNKDSDVQFSMETDPDSAGTIKDDASESEARNIWAQASHLHINVDFRFNSNPIAAAFTNRVTAGGRAWPNLKMDTVAREKATCAWLNGTLGLISYWLESNRITGGRGSISATAIPNIPTLDLRRLTTEQMRAAVQIYDDLCQKRMLPANEAYHDPVRKELDRRLLVEVLLLDKVAAEQLAILRNQWCMEPTVTGSKSTSLAK